MSTNDVPGHKPENRDQLAMGCWAEHEDGSLILVEGVEGGYVTFSVFDMEKEPIIEYRDQMAEGTFKRDFSWQAGNAKIDRWTWHDKTPFPWDRIIDRGGKAGPKMANVEDQLNAAERIQRRRRPRPPTPIDEDLDVDTIDDFEELPRAEADNAARRVARRRGSRGQPLDLSRRPTARSVVDAIQKALDSFRPGRRGGRQR